LGAASEAVGYDRILKTNTSKRREHSLFRQGCMVYDLLPTMPKRWLQPLMLDVYPTARPAAAVLSNPGPGVVAPCIYEGSRETSGYTC
jgi:hypothetical protein